MFKSLEGELRRRGENPLADAVHSLLLVRGKDIPVGVSEFTKEQRTSLEKKGYIVYELTGQTIASLRSVGHALCNSWYKGESLEALASLRADVAIHPRLFLPRSYRKTLDEQLAMVEEFGKKIGAEVPGTTAILGSVADYAELAFAHQIQKGQRLFGKDFDYNYTRTTTPASGSHIVFVGNFQEDSGLHVFSLHRACGHSAVGAAPLIVSTLAVEA